jgi:hypothetical protein
VRTGKHLAGLLLMVSCAWAAQEDAAAPEVRVVGFPWLSQVSGSCWRAELSKGEVEDRQCFKGQFDRVVRVDQTILQKSGAARSTLNADSLYAWDARKRKVRHVFWASDGSFETASGWIEGDALILYLDRETGADGEAPMRTVLRMVGADQYKASREERDGKGWREQFSFVYQRDGSASR